MKGKENVFVIVFQAQFHLQTVSEPNSISYSNYTKYMHIYISTHFALKLIECMCVLVVF